MEDRERARGLITDVVAQIMPADLSAWEGLLRWLASDGESTGRHFTGNQTTTPRQVLLGFVYPAILTQLQCA